MGLFSKILGETVDFAKFVASDIADHAIIREVRKEHDEWMRTVQYGATYYTVDPTIPHRNDLPWSRDIHTSYVFDGRRGQWPYSDELRAHNGATSWRIWWEQGPLTTEWQPTQDYYNIQDDLEEPVMLARMQARLMDQIDKGARATHERAMADIQRRYPRSAALMASNS